MYSEETLPLFTTSFIKVAPLSPFRSSSPRTFAPALSLHLSYDPGGYPPPGLASQSRDISTSRYESQNELAPLDSLHSSCCILYMHSLQTVTTSRDVTYTRTPLFSLFASVSPEASVVYTDNEPLIGQSFQAWIRILSTFFCVEGEKYDIRFIHLE